MNTYHNYSAMRAHLVGLKSLLIIMVMFSLLIVATFFGPILSACSNCLADSIITPPSLSLRGRIDCFRAQRARARLVTNAHKS